MSSEIIFVAFSCLYTVHYMSLFVIHLCMLSFSLQFLGNTEVEAPKGTEVVKDAVRKLKVKPVLSVCCSLKDRGVFLSNRIALETQRKGLSDKCFPPSSVTSKVPLEFFSSRVWMPISAG